MPSGDQTGEYEVHTESNVMAAMRDGVRLAADVYRPAKGGVPVDGAFPVLLQRTPYSKTRADLVAEALSFTSHGYVTVLQDCRARYESEGAFTKYTREGEDGYDTMAWLAQQPWHEGKIGTYGLSYSAHTQAAAACLAPPNLGCMWLDSGGFANAFQTACRNGGAFELRQLTWAYKEAVESRQANADPRVKAALDAQDIFAWFGRLPWKKGHSPLQWTPDYEDYLLDIWERETFDDYWRQIGLCAEAHYGQFSDVPQVHMSAWYDPYSKTATDNYVALSGTKQGPVSLLMGPWTHGGRSVTHAGGVELGPSATIDGATGADFNHLRLRFFDRWLKGKASEWADGPPVKLFVMGGGSGRKNAEGRLEHGGAWRSESDWPLARAAATPFYLHAGGSLSTQQPGNGHPPTKYLFDPERPVPTVGGNISSGQPVMAPGGFDQRESKEFFGSNPPYLPLASRPDVLVFQTEPLAEGAEVTGPVSVQLWISSSAVDTDFTAKLVDVYPPSGDYPEGYTLNLTDGILRVKFRESWEQPELMEPGEVYLLTIDLLPVSNRFMKGHRIRLDISSSNFPRFDVNGNTGENPGTSPVRLTALNSVYHDGSRPSHALLPVVAQE
ncbi:MAG: CocE/NonD family hydrolase [Chloroflexi bacterium]|nr:CocE/NonD family hydrolase [Chloroflexota bacterium]MDA1270404.1 CocE/NonD family hydrolase [Chloroflexota bacterium]PKB58764.1 MAG: antibiotic hydrolase [SAR202 cluster bacterium Casp-Chloro-G2]